MRIIYRYKELIAKLAVLAVAAAALGINPSWAQAASLTQMSDTMSRLQASTASNHTILFVTPTGVASTQNITLTFSAGFTGIGSLVGADFDFAEGSSGTCSSASFTEKSVVTSSPSTSQFSIAGSGQVVTITSGGASATITAGRCVRLKIGLNATDTTGSGPGTHQITNGAIGSSDTIAIAGSFGDSGSIAVEIITDDQVTISATVDPTISFSISANSVSFGTLSTATGRWATSGGGANASAGTDPTTSNTAHTLTVSTNATSGYVVTYNGATLTSGSNTIAPATITGDSDGAPNSSQFALCGKATSGSPTVTSGYVCSTSSDYNFAASTTTTLVTKTSPASSEVVSVAYLANIAGAQAAGAYTTTLTYVATGTF